VSRPRTDRSGFSLVELTVALSVISVILVSLGSVIVVAAKALPSAPGPSAATSNASATLEQLVSELRFATSITESTTNAVTFTVPARSGDTTPETIRYAWSGNIGDPLTRQYNGGAVTNVLTNVQKFGLNFVKQRHTNSTTTTQTQDSGEVVFSTYSGWAGIVPIPSTTALSTTAWASETFVIDQVSIPADATRVAITRVSLKLKKPSSGTVGCTVGLYLPASAGGSTPAASPVGTPFNVPASSLTTSYAWVDATFSDVVFNNPSTTSMVIVVKGIAANSASLQYMNALLAPLDNSVYRYTTNSGTSWQPTSSLNVNDAPYTVYGSYQRQVTTTVNVDTYTLGSVAVNLIPNNPGSPRLDTAVEILNEPAITGP
jgi:prepilin-type N-terminal cleavage/methylation domain-containing protein